MRSQILRENELKSLLYYYQYQKIMNITKEHPQYLQSHEPGRLYNYTRCIIVYTPFFEKKVETRELQKYLYAYSDFSLIEEFI